MENVLNLKPSAGYYTITPIDADKSSDDIVLVSDPEKKQGDPYVKGKIVSVGEPYKTEGGKEVAPEYNVGDMVWYSYSGFEEITDKGKKVRVIRFNAVVAKDESK